MEPAGKTLRHLLCAIGCILIGGAFTLPAERTVEYADPSGETWREEGKLRVSVAAAREMWELALRREGWRCERVIPLETVSARHLEVWRKGEDTLLLGLWSVAPGVSGYQWGIMKREP